MRASIAIPCLVLVGAAWQSAALAQAPGRPAAGVPPEVVLAVDDSGSMAGYAAGNDCYDLLWQEVFDRSLIEVGLADLKTLTVGSTTRPGPSRAELPRLADPKRYVEQTSEIVKFLQDWRTFTFTGDRIVALVSDLEPHVTSPDPGCAGNGSVLCLAGAIHELARKGWSLTVLGFPTQFSGKRSMPKFLPDGSVGWEIRPLSGAQVPVYILIAYRHPKGGQFVDSIARGLGSCSQREIRRLDLAPLAPPEARLLFERQLGAVRELEPREAPPSSCNPEKQEGDVALRLSAGRDSDRRATVKVYEDGDPVGLCLPVEIGLPPATVAASPLRWIIELVLESVPPVPAPNGGVISELGRMTTSGWVPITSQNRLTVDRGQPHQKVQAVLRLDPKLLEKAGQAAVTLKLLARPELGDRPWSDWSYHALGETGAERRTYRTAEVFEDVLKRSSEAVEVGSLTITLRR